MCLMPLLHTFFPGIDPNAEYAVLIFSFIIVGLFVIQFAAMYRPARTR